MTHAPPDGVSGGIRVPRLPSGEFAKGKSGR